MRYVAFLRGINLGKRRVKNTDLSTAFEAMGFEHVTVLIASGNVIFEANERDEAKLAQQIEDGLERALGFTVDTILRSADEIRAMLDLDPFKVIEVTKETRRYVTLLAEPTASTMALPHEVGDGAFRILSRTDREVFSVLVLKDGSRTVDLMAVLEKEYGKRATTRNWNTIVKAAAL
jgi:uncharacterized protein (DUF1697 family)